ncbi:uncharacterized protein LOC127867345 isoform X2 [Dreissena polymorpha]|uniref:uncharacterized protein LOC127867345 isoform X2 n=1 Tax=Dreissena polymorpha TaxID=45954 RepID=UPI0022644DBB|nr:uncharacterized protein LOC127867345 isoform X2 [Dreissena polymorpha]
MTGLSFSDRTGRSKMKPMTANMIMIFGVFACFIGLIPLNSAIRIETLPEQRGEERLGCFANTSFRFDFTNERNYTIKIGSCPTPPTSECMLFNQTFTNKYDISSTTDGGVLTIRNCNKNDFGTYTCVNKLDESQRNSRNLVCTATSGGLSNTGTYLIMVFSILCKCIELKK